jgi:hypothetical protein
MIPSPSKSADKSVARKNKPNGFLPYGKLFYLRDISINDIRNSAEGFSTLLHVAAACGNEAIVQILLKQGCDPLARDSLRFAPLHRCVRLGGAGLATMRALLDCQPNASVAKDTYGRTPRAILEEKTAEQLSSDDWEAIALLKQAEGIVEERVRKRMHREQYVRQVQARQLDRGAASSIESYASNAIRGSIANFETKNSDGAAIATPSTKQSPQDDGHESDLPSALGSLTIDENPPSSPAINRSHSSGDLLKTHASRMSPTDSAPIMQGDTFLRGSGTEQIKNHENTSASVTASVSRNKASGSGTGYIAIVDAIASDGSGYANKRDLNFESGYSSDSEILGQLSWHSRIDINRRSSGSEKKTAAHSGVVEYERLYQFAEQYFTSDLRRLCREVLPSAVNIRKASRVLRILLESASFHAGLGKSKASRLSQKLPDDLKVSAIMLPTGSSIEESDADGILSYGEKAQRFLELTPNAHIGSSFYYEDNIADRSSAISEALRDGFVCQWDTSSLLNVHAALSFKQYESKLMSSGGFNGRILHLEYDAANSKEFDDFTTSAPDAIASSTDTPSAIRGRMVVVPIDVDADADADESRAAKQWQAFNDMVKDLEALRSSTTTHDGDAMYATADSAKLDEDRAFYSSPDRGPMGGQRKRRPPSLMSGLSSAVNKTTRLPPTRSFLSLGAWNRSRVSPSRRRHYRHYRSESQRQLALQEARRELQRKQLWALLQQPSAEYMQDRQFWDTWTAYANAAKSSPAVRPRSESKHDGIIIEISPDRDEKALSRSGSTSNDYNTADKISSENISRNIAVMGDVGRSARDAGSAPALKPPSAPLIAPKAASAATSSTVHAPINKPIINSKPDADVVASIAPSAKSDVKGTNSMLTDAKVVACESFKLHL